ncbi:MAG: hypothetical protein OXC79_10170 [Candidatus Poribacteria bacterium]|nr:hypothetical protein [Candidatus Poribacteria bacterium]
MPVSESDTAAADPFEMLPQQQRDTGGIAMVTFEGHRYIGG